MRLSVCFAMVVLVAAATAGCAQSNSSELGSPAAPGSVSESLAAGPGAGYNASGVWVIVIDVPRTGESFDEEVEFNQGADGSITFVIDEELVTFTRLGPGNGRVITYRVSSVGDVAQCTETSSGTVTIDTQTNTGRGQVAVVEENCEEGHILVTLTKK